MDARAKTRRRLNHRPQPLSLALLLACATAPSVAFAGAEYDELLRLNDAVNQARSLLPLDVGGRVNAEGEALGKLDEAAATLRHALTARLQSEATVYAEVTANLTDLESWIATLKLSHTCNVARQAILQDQDAGRHAGEALFAAYDATVAQLSARARPEAAAHAEFYKSQAQALRQADAGVDAVAERRRADAAETARQARVHDLVASGNEKLQALEALNAKLQPITADSLAPLDQVVRALEGEDAEAARYFADRRFAFRLELDWNKASPEGETALAADLAGAIAIKGKGRGKTQTLAVKGKAGKCYALLTHLDGYTGNEKLEVAWSTTARNVYLEELSVQQAPGWKGLPAFVACTSRNAPISAKLSASVTPQKGLRYVVVEMGHDSLPAPLVAQLEVMPVDHCDTKAWEELWTQPPPGSLAYVDGEPVIIRRSAAGGAVDYWTAGSPKSHVAPLEKLAAAPAGNVAVSSTLEAVGCPNDAELGPARSPAARKLVQCRATVDRKYAARWKTVERLRTVAAQQGLSTAAADEAAAGIQKEQTAERDKKCGPQEKDAAQRFEQSFASLRTQLGSRRGADPSGRLPALRAYAHALALAAAVPVAAPPPPKDAEIAADSLALPQLATARHAIALEPPAPPLGNVAQNASAPASGSLLAALAPPEPPADAGTPAGLNVVPASAAHEVTAGEVPAEAFTEAAESHPEGGGAPAAAGASADAPPPREFIKGELIYPGTRRLLSRYNHAGVSIGPDIIGNDIFATVDPGMAWYFDNGLSFSLHVPLRLLVIPEGRLEFGGLRVRREDWNEIADYAKVIRFLTYGRKESNLYFTINTMRPATIGHGMLVNRYQGDMDVDRSLTGVMFDAYNRYAGFELQANDITFSNRIVGGLVFVKPLSLLGNSPYAEGFSLGVEGAADLRAPRCVRLAKGAADCVQGLGHAAGDNPYSGGTLDHTFVRSDPDTGRFAVKETTVSALGLSTEAKVYKDAEHADIKLYGNWNRFTNTGGGDGIAGGVLARLNFGDTWISALRLRTEYRTFGDGFSPSYFDSLYEIQKYSYPYRTRDLQVSPTKYQAVFGDAANGFARPHDGWRQGYNLEGSWGLFYNKRSAKKVAMGFGLSQANRADDTSAYLHIEAPALAWLQVFGTFMRVNVGDVKQAFNLGAWNAQQTVLLTGLRLEVLPILFINAHYSRSYRVVASPGSEYHLGNGKIVDANGVASPYFKADRLFENVQTLLVQLELGWEFSND
jgi:hypothetical protein